MIPENIKNQNITPHNKKDVFRFRQFSVAHRNSTMKVGTDAVLLGIFAGEGSRPHHILDIGTGSGVIALILAQRFPKANIQAIDIDQPSVEEARYNFLRSPWKERLKVFHTGLEEFSKTTSARYDLMICNPPFFKNATLSPSERKNMTRHAGSLTVPFLLETAGRLLTENGIFSLIFPFEQRKEVLQKAGEHELYCHRRLDIFPKKHLSPNRCILELRKGKTDCQQDSLTIYNGDNTYTKEYRRYGRDFYL